MIALRCDMQSTCPEAVTHVDVKGFVYCTAHGEKRKITVPCRKLTTTEIAKLGRGETIAYRRTRKAKETTSTPVLNAEQHAALAAFAAKHGRTWKDILRGKWSNGSDANEPMGGLLRQVRNAFGPSWLEKFRFDDATHAAALRESAKPSESEPSAPDELPITNEQIKAVALAANKSGDHELAQLCLKALGRHPEDADPAARQAVAVRLQVPRCAASMGCLCAGHARGNDVLAACDTRETDEIDVLVDREISGELRYLTRGGFDDSDVNYCVGWICALLRNNDIDHEREDVKARIRGVMERVSKEPKEAVS